MGKKVKDDRYESIPAMFQRQVVKYGDRECVRYKKDGKYVSLSWIQMNDLIHEMAYYLLSLGIKHGDRIGLFSENRYEWWVCDQAILSVGAVNVPIYATNSSEEAFYILKDSESKVCIAGTADHLEKIQKVKSKLPKLKNLIVLNEITKTKKGLVSASMAYESGKKFKNKPLLDKRMNEIDPLNDLATIMYTSGTTGNPKGVMLTHDNFVSDVKNTNKDIEYLLSDKDLFLSFLPLSHVLERCCGYYGAVNEGATVAFAEDISKLMQNFTEVRPTIIISVPRIYERLHSGIVSKVTDAPVLKKAIFNFAVNTARRNLPYACLEKPRPLFLDIKFKIADKIVFSNLKAALGLDKLRFAISGGAPLAVTDAEFFIGMGLIVLEGFGLTETSPVTNYNRPGFIKPGTVGQATRETQVRISDEGEILFKGPQVMKGYYKNPAATKEAFTKDGFFKTGDIGMIDEDGCLSITGRIKDIIVTAGGKNISPQNIENSLKESRYIEQVAIIGDRRKYLCALIVPVFDEVKKWSVRKGMVIGNNDELIKNEEVIKLIAVDIEKYTQHYSRVEQIKQFRLLNAEWTQDTGELTPSQKIKRRVIEKKYADEIEGMYPPE
jgi:long-chain acyl-CoA synthetase